MIANFDLAQLFLFPVKDNEARKNFLIAALVYFASFIVPIIPIIFAMGYTARIMRRVINGEEPRMVAWSDWESMFKDGLYLFGVRLAYSLPIIIIVVPLYIGMMLTPVWMEMGNNTNDAMAFAPFLLFGLGMIVIFPLSLALGIILPAAENHVVTTSEFAAGFRVREWWAIFRANWTGFLLAYLVAIVASSILSMLVGVAMITIVLFCVLPFIMPAIAAYLNFVMYAAFAQAYNKEKPASLHKPKANMRPLEILLPILLAVYLIAPFFTRHRFIKYIPPLALLISLVHLEVEGYRWQMIPLYVLTAALALANLRGFFKADSAIERPRGWRAAASILTLILVALATALPAILPVPRIANPTGPFPVGTRSIVLTDASRKELYSGRDESRKFMIQVWYPAAPGKEDVHAPWVANAGPFANANARQLDLPEFFLDHLVYSKSPAFQDAPLEISNAVYPVIVFSHGWNGFAAQSTAQMVELASHGYVVVGMQHTYGAIITIFPDGEVADNNPNALPDGMPEPGYTDTARLLVDQWSGDISFTLDFLADQNADNSSPFHAALDLTRIGVYGHSTGGGAAVQFCGADPRCAVGMAEDPFMTPVSQEVQDRGLKQPFLFLFSQEWRDNSGSKNNNLFDAFLPKVSRPIGVATILGTRHYDFTDIPLLSPLAPQLGLKGPIDGKRVVKVINDYLVAYFDQELKGIVSALPFGPSDEYPELRWESK